MNGAAFAVVHSTAGGAGAVPKRWSWVDINGLAYGANDRRDAIIKLNGATLTTPSTMPLGSIMSLTQDRLVVSDITGNINRVYYSSAGAVEVFTVGANPEDSFHDDLGPPGERVTGLKYVRGFLYVFKSDSITSCELGDQYTTRCVVVSPNIGTNDPASIVAAGTEVYFKGNDGGYWRLGGNGLEQISRKISATISAQAEGGERSNTQTTQADWQAGTQKPASNAWNTTTTFGSIFPSSVTFIDGNGGNNFSVTTTSTSVSTAAAGVAITLRISSMTFPDATDMSEWTYDAGTGSDEAWSLQTTPARCYPTTAPYSGQWTSAPTGYTCSDYGSQPKDLEVRVETNSGVLISSVNYADSYFDNTSVCSTNTLSIPRTEFETYQNTPVRVKFTMNSCRSGAGCTRVAREFYSPLAGLGQNLQWHQEKGNGLYGESANSCVVRFTVNQSTGFALSGLWLSSTFDTGFTTPTYSGFTVNYSSSSTAPVTFKTYASADGSTFDSGVTATPGTKIASAQKRYLRWEGTFSTTNENQSGQVNSVTLAVATTGQFLTQCIQPGSSISSWGTLSCAETKTGTASLVYYSTSAATCATLPGTTPMEWQNTETNNATLTLGTNTAMYIGFRSLLNSATEQAQVDSCIVNWVEGTPVQPVWGVWDSIKNAIYWTYTSSTSASADRLQKYDLNLGGWFPMSISAQAPLMQEGVLYFGGSAAGTWNRYGQNDSDNGSAFNAYWKTRDIGAASPFVDKDFKRVSALFRNQGSGNLTSTWTNSIGKTGSYTISLSTGTGLNYARNNYYLPQSSPQAFLNLNFGNNAANQPFEILGIQVDFFSREWRPGGP